MRAYSIYADNITVAGATTLAALRPDAGQAIEIVEVRVGFSTNAVSEQQRIHLCTQAVGSVALTAMTPVPYDKSNTQASTITGGTSGAAGTAGVNATVEGGARTILVPDALNHLNGFLWSPHPKARIVLPGGYANMFAVWFPDAPNPLTGWTCCVSFVELS